MTWGPYWDTPHPRRSSYRDDNQFNRDRDSRRYYQHAMGLPYSQSTQGDDDGECASCSQRSEQGGSEYGENDTCKRHRKKDGEEYSEKVVAYKRRKPKT